MHVLVFFSRIRPYFLVAVAVLAALFVARSDVSAISFTPVYTAALTSPIAGANSDSSVVLNIPAPDANFSAVIGFLDENTGIGTCPANNYSAATRACADQAVPNGALVAKTVSDATLGLVNNPCNSVISGITFDLMDATTDMTNVVVFEDTDANNKGQQFEDKDGNGLPDGVDKYPDYLTRLIYGPEVFGTPGSAPLQPLQRSYGQTVVAGTDVSLQFLVMEKGIKINGLQLNPADGFPVVTVLQNTGDPGAVPQPPTITDFCSPLASTTTRYGITRNNPATTASEGAYVYATNPNAGSYNAHILLFSQRDQDGDNIENQLDPCSGSSDAGWNPRSSATDASYDKDHDGLPVSCDPNDNSSNTDQDGDGFLNRGDNCPLIANPLQTDLDRDGLGAGCDPDDNTPSPNLKSYPADYLTTGNTQFGTYNITVGKQGDTNCSGGVNSVDSLQVLRKAASLGPFGACANVAGDVNCNGSINSVDALLILRYSAGLSVNQPPGCTAIGSPLS